MWESRAELAVGNRRAAIKRLAAHASRVWSKAPPLASLAGETRVETRNSVYLLRDGVCHTIRAREDGSASSTHKKADIFGMRLVGWVANSDPHAALQLEWTRGMHAVLWRPRRGGERHSVVALTSPTLAFRSV